MASLTRGVSFRRQGSSGRSWAENLGLNEPQQQRFSRQPKSDGITKKTIMVPDAAEDPKMNSSAHREDRMRKSARSGGGVLNWLRNRFRKTRS